MDKPQEPITENHEYLALLDEFYELNWDMISTEDYEKAKEDPVYFKALVRRLTDLYQRMGRELLLNDRNYHVWEKEFRRREKSRD